ncbi:MAG TPA: 4Fe-4S dicluster domain-containing protein [Polyangia bacterium]|nr:4Fe-4S dicluster domain-containing protein [Polyangia bacterium]
MDHHDSDALYQIRRLPAGERPWRSLAELEPRGAPSAAGEFFPQQLERPEIDRRRFMQLAGASLALAGAAGCAMDVPRKIMPYTKRPPHVLPGEARFYATSMVVDGYASGILVASHEGRPTKIEANLQHPSTLGGTNMFQQAAVRQLYDDMRARAPRRGEAPTSWDDVLQLLWRPRQDRGAGLRLLLEPTSSPLLLDLIGRVQARYPQARVAFFAPLEARNHLEATRAAFGRPLLPQYDFSRAQAIVSLDCDFMYSLPFSVRYARQWAGRRRLDSPQGEMNRLYVVESLLSVTGSVADHRLRRPLSQIPQTALALATNFPDLPLPVRGAAIEQGAPADPWVTQAARDLAGRPAGTTVVVVGDRQPPAVHALGYALNAALGNLGRTVSFTEPVVPFAGGHPGLIPFESLVAEMHAGQVDTLLLLDTNPCYAAPADLNFCGALARVAESLCFGYYQDETADRCTVFGPTPHFLESWGDARAYDGTVSMIQPLIRPLVETKTAGEILAALAGEPDPDAYRLLRGHWLRAGALDEESWQRAVQDGLVAGTAAPAVDATVEPAGVARLLRALRPSPPPAGDPRLEVEIYPSPTVYDGRFANNAWLLEQPDPITKLTWDNAALVSVATARRLHLQTENIVTLRAGAASVRAPVLVVPGLADDVVAVWLGYGRSGQEALAAGVGFNAFPLRTTAAPHHAPVQEIRRVEGYHELAQTQIHFSMEGRPIALKRTLPEYRKDPEFTREYKGPVDSLLPEFEYRGPQWAMSIDLGICIGCSACMVACQSENNLLVVGKSNVLRHRQMHWLRIDTYYSGIPDEPGLVHQPMACQHCEKAPCEYVCPVNATVHSPDGLNEMVYNRCVGTRFCSNNCPYKVRRFNWFDFTHEVAANRGLVQLHYNPEVTVRERGVMEKCTYCVQRIRAAEIHARVDKREIAAGEVVTACEAACPTGAIQFGSLTHRDTPMVRWRQQDRSFAVLHDQGTQPRTHYLARIENPNPEIG